VVLKLLKTQFDVVKALTVREIQSQQANLAYGYGWVLFDAVLSFTGLMVMKVAIRAFNVPGLPPVTYLVSGLIPWFLFQSAYTAPASAIKRNQRLLSMPGVTPLDLVLAGSLQILCTYGLLFPVAATISSFYEKVSFPRFPLGVILLFICCWLIGVSFGLVVMIFTRLYAPAGKFVSFFMRFALILSGVVVSIKLFPESVWPYLAWNPMLHVEELLRVYWFTGYASPIANPAYVLECLVVLMCAGLLVERYVRRRLPA
jgi:capsular polysaccharide transport system permease protein